MEIGEYVRNKYGIAKVIYKENYNGIDVYHLDRDVCFLINKETGEEKYRCSSFANTKEIDMNKIKHSKNIIDLIEIGDYINGEKIIKISNGYYGEKVLIYGIDDRKHQLAKTIYEEDIKTILTKEQFKELEYEIC